MEIHEDLIESYLSALQIQNQKLEKARNGLLQINKIAADIQRNFKHKDFHVDTAARQITDEVMKSI